MSDDAPTVKARLEIAIDGEGISPREISIKHLADLLEAAASTIDAIAAETGRPAVQPSLVEIREGSAAYDLSAGTVAWPATVGLFYEAVRTRGESYGPRVRSGLGKLFRSARVGSVRVRAVGLPDSRYDAPLHLALPLEVVHFDVTHAQDIYGRIVGVNQFERRTTVRLELIDGGREDFEVSSHLAERAARLFNRTVRVRSVATRNGDKDVAWRLESLEPWTPDELLVALDRAREQLVERGLSFDPDEWIRGLDE